MQKEYSGPQIQIELSGRAMALQYLSEGSRLGVDTFFLEVKEKEYP